jgi:hypothetical protein
MKNVVTTVFTVVISDDSTIIPSGLPITVTGCVAVAKTLIFNAGTISIIHDSSLTTQPCGYSIQSLAYASPLVGSCLLAGMPCKISIVSANLDTSYTITAWLNSMSV